MAKYFIWLPYMCVFGVKSDRLLGAEMDEHLGYQKNQVSDTSNSRNGYSNKTIKGDHGEVKIAIPRDRESSLNRLLLKGSSPDRVGNHHSVNPSG